MRRLVVVVAVALAAAGCGSVERGTTRLEGTRAIGEVPSTPDTTGPRSIVPTPPSSAPATSGGTAPSTATTAPTPAPTIAWQSCGARLQCATLSVPKDYADPSQGRMELFLKRRPAERANRRIGSLLVNPGGPGVPGTVLVDQATGAFGRALLERFDIVAWDPRGTGKSDQVVCVDDLDPYFSLDLSPDDDGEHQALFDSARDFGQRCQRRNADLLPYVSTQATARDMNEIRRALGEDKISYFGFSYGSELGAVWATLFPETVRAMVIDGAIDPNASVADENRQTAVGLERALDNLLADCAADRDCPIHNGGDPGAVFDRVLAGLDTDPLELTGENADRPPVNQGVASWAVLNVLYQSALWPALTSAIAEAERGNGRPLLDLYDSYVTLGGQYPHVFDALIAINCLDDSGELSQAEYDALDAEMKRLAPRMGPYLMGPPFCVDWPVPPLPPVTVTGAGAGPVVVVATTGDPVTPLESSARMAEALEGGVLITADAAQHTGYQTSECIDEAIERYLLELRVPQAGLVCG